MTTLNELRQMFTDKLHTPRSSESVDAIYSMTVDALSKQDAWPPCSISEAMKWMRSTKDKMKPDEYLGMQATFLAIASASIEDWPPMPPDRFAAIAMPGIRKSFGKFVNSVVAEDNP